MATVIDERSRPGFGELYAINARAARELDAAVGRIRLGGITLGKAELEALRRIRLLVGGMNALAFGCDLEALAVDPTRRARLTFLTSMLEKRTLEVRVAPLAGWKPDFSIFRRSNDRKPGDGQILSAMIGPHWFERPYPHPGPALGVTLDGKEALVLADRFEETWEQGHDLRRPLLQMLKRGLQRVAPSVLAG